MLEPERAFLGQLVDEVDFYERLKRGEFGEFTNFQVVLCHVDRARHAHREATVVGRADHVRVVRAAVLVAQSTASNVKRLDSLVIGLVNRTFQREDSPSIIVSNSPSFASIVFASPNIAKPGPR